MTDREAVGRPAQTARKPELVETAFRLGLGRSRAALAVVPVEELRRRVIRAQREGGGAR